MKSFSYLHHLVCSRCGTEYPSDGVIETCECGAPLFAEYDYERLKQEFTKEELKSRPNNLWRYHELLPIRNPENVVSLDEHMTGILPMKRLGSKYGMHHLLVKNEGTLPSGTFKARGSAVGISKAKELGVNGIAIPTNGNAGAAWSLYAARAGLPAVVVMPETAPRVPMTECHMSGADLFVIDGTIGDAGHVIREMAEEKQLYNVSTLNEPYRLEGKKTMGLEIAEQFQWSPPDVIVYPTGGGAGVIGIYKAFRELRRIGWLKGPVPRLVVVQSVGCSPLVRAFENQEMTTVEWTNPETIAFGMRVPKPLGDFLILKELYETHGTALTVTDEEILEAQQKAIQLEGLHVCPEGGAALAGVAKLRQEGWLKAEERVLVVNTGSGLKYVDPTAIEDKLIRLQKDTIQ